MKLIKFKHNEQYELSFHKIDGSRSGLHPISGEELLKAVEDYVKTYWNEVESVTVTTKRIK